MDQVREVSKGAHQRQREPVTRRLSDTNLVLHVVREVRQRVALLQTQLLGDLFVTAGERNRLERKECNLLRIVQSETNDRADLIVVDAVDERGDEHDLNARFVQVIDRAHLHVEEVADLAVTVRIVADTVELKVNVTQSCFGSLPAELFALGKFDSVGRRLHAVVTNLARVADRFDEVRRDRRLTTRELYGHLATRLDGDRVVENLLDLVHAQFMNKANLVGVHEARVDRKSTRLNSSHVALSRMPSSA